MTGRVGWSGEMGGEDMRDRRQMGPGKKAGGEMEGKQGGKGRRDEGRSLTGAHIIS